MKKGIQIKVAGSIFIVVILLSLGVIAVAAVPSTPALPNKFWGYLSVNGVDAPVGTVIEAYIDDELRASVNISVAGEYGSDFNYLAVTGTRLDRGKVIEFRITLPDGRGMIAPETSEWVYMSPPRGLDLTGVVPPIVGDPSVDPAVIPDDTDNDPLWGEEATLSVTVTDICDISSVTIDLSSIGGSSEAVMNTLGGGLYTISTNATSGTLPDTYLLPVNATNAVGLSDTSIAIDLTVKKNGDVDDDGNVDIDDAIYLARHAFGFVGYDLIDEIADVDGSGAVNLLDAGYLYTHLNGIAGYELLK